MILPKSLGPGSRIGITCPSGYVAADRIGYAAKLFGQWGFAVKTGRTVGTEHHYFSGTDEARAADLQEMLDDPGLDAIVMGRGGYGMSRIVDRLDLSGFLQKPKWICGFSDITVLHQHLAARYGVASLHSPMCGAFTEQSAGEDYIKSFRSAICGEALEYRFPAGDLHRDGAVTGVLTGGNLSLLVHLLGTPSDVDTRGKILFLEDLSEYLYHIDRMMVQLKRAGKLEGLAGLVLGGFTELKDTERPFGQSVEELIFDKVREYGYPVCFNAPAGHQEINFPLVLGADYRLEVAAGKALLLTGSRP